MADAEVVQYWQSSLNRTLQLMESLRTGRWVPSTPNRAWLYLREQANLERNMLRRAMDDTPPVSRRPIV